MLNVTRTLAPESGLTKSYQVFPPAPDLRLWQVVIDLGFRPTSDQEEDQTLHLVGASDLSRRRAFERGVGEAVERRALRPESCIEREFSGVTFDWEKHGLASASLADDESLPGRVLADGSRVEVPIGLVDYDQASTCLAVEADDRYDVSPSGAASGGSFIDATMAGLLELIERDAVMVAWGRQLRATSVGPESFDSDERRLVAPILDTYAQAGLEYKVADLHTDVDGVHAYAALCFDVEGRLGALGSKAASSPAASFVGCLQEALQALHLARTVRKQFGPSPLVSATPRTELERAKFWSTEAAYEHLRSWSETFTPSSYPVAPSAPVSVKGLVDAVVEVGGQPIVVDLGSRLPSALQEIGWQSVKVLCPGLQPLRLDDSLAFSWLPARMSSASARTGYTASTSQDDVFGVPHPLV